MLEVLTQIGLKAPVHERRTGEAFFDFLGRNWLHIFPCHHTVGSISKPCRIEAKSHMHVIKHRKGAKET